MRKSLDAAASTDYESRPKFPMPRHAETIAVFIPGPLRDSCAGAAELAVPARNLREVLAHLEERFPALHRSICEETGALRRHINLFVNHDHMRDRDGLSTVLTAGDEVFILPAVSGG